MEEVQTFSALFNFEKTFLLALSILGLWLFARALQYTLEKLASYIPSKRFLVLQTSTFSSFVIYLGGTIILFIMIIDPPKEVVLAAAGSLAVAIGFALKDIALSIIAGIVLIFDTPFKTGDRVYFDGSYGDILTIGLRSVKLRTLDDNIVTIPNSRFISDTVASSNYGALDMMVVSSFHIGLNNNIEKVKDIIREVIVTSRFSFLKKDVSFAVNEVILHDKVVLKIDAKAYVIDTRYEKAFQSDVISTANQLFLEQSIVRP